MVKRPKKSFKSTKINTKDLGDRILIVCEGEKTEPEYFLDFCKENNLSNRVTVCGEECDNVPSKVYNYTIQKIDENLKDYKSDKFDRAYCVFDKDEHPCYEKTLKKIEENPNYQDTTIIAANSVPCFEFWILLHFKPTTSNFKNSNALEKEIKRHVVDYSKKATKNLYSIINHKTDDAVKNAKFANREAAKSRTDNPTTYVHLLVEDLIEQSNRF